VTWILDLDGVVWRGDDPIPGSADAIARLRAAGEQVRFLTNNSSMTVAQYGEKLGRMGIAAGDGDVLSSAMAAATLVSPGERVLLCAGAGAEEALVARGVEVVRDGAADAVLVGWHRDFDFDGLARAARAVHGGARLLATNDDPTYPAADGLLPGAGAILAAVERASGVTAVVAGKPNEAMADLVRSSITPGSTMVGDRPSTDGLLARRVGIRFALVLTGIVTRADLPVEPEPDVVADDLDALVPADQSPS
jgi:HAD superfamily hydrolase (TIGR01450 family)